MNFKLMSDLHLEFYGRTQYLVKEQPVWEPEQLCGDEETILLLAGDIHTGKKAEPWIRLMCERYKHVVYILGNHEFYGNEWFTVKHFWRTVDMPENFTFLDDDVMYIEDTRILGATLWTGIRDQTDNYGFTVWNGKMRMMDYQVTGYDNRRLNPQDTVNAHHDTVKFLKTELAKPWKEQTIVMTHHLPHEKCVAERFKGDGLNAFFVTDLDDIIKEYDIDFWVHGHTHDAVDVTVHGTRILCNPRGYHGVQLNQDYKEDLVFGD